MTTASTEIPSASRSESQAPDASTQMLSSHPVTIGGHFVGIMVARRGDWLFLTREPALSGLSAALFPSRGAVTRAVQRAWHQDRSEATA
ncbi:hypothetical protein LPC08_17045 [Roseomonas sp. OT10]|uniref:hypothetical protein n=1 Tax=Roseomonas cutis TaxID=2897332 RepID=UPI001E380BE0|nr:hypothetical protein [Roseomonas sp. OT10]UFN47710.1 hypothetical protein LPC08_17045 [Roseomonas sp. OT10]